MVMCWAPDCKHYNVKDSCRFFAFPTDKKLRNRWIKLVRRDVEPGPGARLCSCHFPEGKKENEPVLFSHNIEKRFEFPSPEKKKKKRATVSTTVEAESSEDETELPVEVTSEPGPSSLSVPTTSTALLETEVYFLKQEVGKLRSEARGGPFSFKENENNDSPCRLYTGLPRSQSFIALYKMLENIRITYYLDWTVEKVPKIDQLLMCLMKLRQNYPHEDLAHRFKVSQATVTNIVITWVHLLHEVLHEHFSSKIPSRKKNQTCLPNAFSKFTNCRVVLDCTEMAMTVPRTSMAMQKITYSSYKHKNTWKALIGVAPNGVTTYLSSLYPGANSDKKIVQQCGVLEQLEAGDLILADKGFLIRDLLPNGVSLNIPPFLQTAQFTASQIKQTETIARARIHVERARERMKRFKILNFIPRSLFEHAEEIFQVIGALTNLQDPLIDEVKSLYSSSDSE